MRLGCWRGKWRRERIYAFRKIYGVGEDIKCIVCLAKNITETATKTMVEYAPDRIVFAEQCFENSTDKSNVRLTLKDKGIAINTL